jgi:hypothetical protein
MSASRQLEDRSEQYRWAPGRTSSLGSGAQPRPWASWIT